MLQLLRKRKKNLSIVLSLLLLTLTVGCQLTNSKDSLVVDKMDYSGEQIFRGIFFGQGAVAPLLSTYSVMKKINQNIEKSGKAKKFKKARNLLMQTIGSMHPDFFNYFEQKMESGDRVIIKRGLAKATRYIKEAISSIIGKDFNAILTSAGTQNMVEEMDKEVMLKKLNNGTLEASVSEYKDLLKTGYTTANVEVGLKKASIVTVVAAIAAVVAAAVVVVAFNIYIAVKQPEKANYTQLQTSELINSIAVELDKNIASEN